MNARSHCHRLRDLHRACEERIVDGEDRDRVDIGADGRHVAGRRQRSGCDRHARTGAGIVDWRADGDARRCGQTSSARAARRKGA